LSAAPRATGDFPARVRARWIRRRVCAAIKSALCLAKTFAAISLPLRRVRYYDAQTDQYLIFLTNHLNLPGLTVADKG